MDIMQLALIAGPHRFRARFFYGPDRRFHHYMECSKCSAILRTLPLSKVMICSPRSASAGISITQTAYMSGQSAAGVRK